MGWNDHLEDDGGYADFLQEVVDGESLDGAALGITKLVIDKGVDALSSKQRFVFDSQVLGQYTVKACTRCGSEIPWSEMYAALDNGGLCNYCWHMTEKSKEE
jgi:hypothetical protein